MLNNEINRDIPFKKNALIEKIQSLLENEKIVDFKKVLKQEKKDFLSFFLKALYINEKRKQFSPFQNLNISFTTNISVIYFYIFQENLCRTTHILLNICNLNSQI